MFFLQLLLYLTSMVITPLSQQQDCYFIDTINSSQVLDLRALNEITLQYSDGIGQYNYSYSICSNNLPCLLYTGQEIYVMSYQYDLPATDCLWLAQWDDNDIKQPSYNSSSQIWTFPQFEGQSCYDFGGISRNTTIHWQCDETVESAQISSVNEPVPCIYDITIESKYACTNTPPPFCSWYGNNGALLDLTVYQDTTITAIDTSISQYIFAYTPCRNGLECGGQGMEVMSKLENISNSACVSYLSVWDDSNDNNTTPYYDDENKVWEFRYYNGQNCGNQLPSSFYVYWFCNPSIIAPNFNVKKAENVAPCLYELEIESNVAC